MFLAVTTIRAVVVAVVVVVAMFSPVAVPAWGRKNLQSMLSSLLWSPLWKQAALLSSLPPPSPSALARDQTIERARTGRPDPILVVMCGESRAEATSTQRRKFARKGRRERRERRRQKGLFFLSSTSSS